jgi:hypothetical protein
VTCDEFGNRGGFPLSSVASLRRAFLSECPTRQETRSGYGTISGTNLPGSQSTAHGKYPNRGSNAWFDFASAGMARVTRCNFTASGKSAHLHAGTPRGFTASALAWARTMALGIRAAAGTRLAKRLLYLGAYRSTPSAY